MTHSETSKTPTKVVGICGSLRSGSFTRQIIQIALQGAKNAGAETELIDLRDYELVFFGAKEEDDYPEDVFKLRRKVHESQGIILGTPEYHGSLSGVLKNALDLMGFDEFEGKMMGLVGVSGGRLGAVNALNSLRNIGRNLHAWVLPQQVSIPEAYLYFNDDGQLVNEDYLHRLQTIGEMLARFASLHEIQKDDAFIKMWEGLAVNPGGKK